MTKIVHNSKTVMFDWDQKDYSNDDDVITSFSLKTALDSKSLYRPKKPKAIKRHKVSKFARVYIYTRDSFTCLKCGSKDNLTVDHVKPLSLYGSNDLSNLQTLCYSCNQKKRNQIADYRKSIFLDAATKSTLPKGDKIKF